MIVIKLLGGFGNQLFQYAYGCHLENNGYHVRFNTSALIPGTHREYSLKEFGLTIPISEEISPVVYEKNLSFDPGMLYPSDDSTLVGYWQNEKYFEDVASKFRSDINFIWIKQLSYKPKLVDIKNQIYLSNSVFIHVRRQDYLNLLHFHGMLGKDYYDKAVQYIRERTLDPKFFVFSDDPDWSRENLPDFNIISGNTKYEDLQLMVGCKHAIIANSSFSWWGAWLNDNQSGRIVIAPKRWFTADVEEEIVPDRWIKL